MPFFFRALFIYLPLALFLLSCDDDEPIYSPKPRGYPRIVFPQKQYRLLDTACAYIFEVPVYSRIIADPHKNAEPCWYNIEFPAFRATVHLSYKNVNNDIAKYIDDAHNFANKHQVKATGLNETVVLRDSAKVYGLLFDIAGNTASSVQFYLTDSSRHFLRGSLYFNTVPNIDSLKLVVDFIREDILHLINTARWKNPASGKTKS
jgi:gliding motility-associated lipoprotein GldD